MEGQRTRLTKRLIGESLIRLMNEKPLTEITVAELCREAGINRTTFYRYYQTPGDILPEIQSEVHREYRQELTGTESDFDRLTVMIRKAGQNRERASAINSEVNRIVQAESGGDSSDDLFYRLLAGKVPEDMRGYARRMTSDAMTLWLEEGCRLDAAQLSRMMLDVCAVCTKLSAEGHGEKDE